MEGSRRNTKKCGNLFLSGTIGTLIAMNMFTLGENLYLNTWSHFSSCLVLMQRTTIRRRDTHS